MSTFRRTYELEVDGDRLEVTTRPADFLGAERDLVAEGMADATTKLPIALQTRIVWRAFTRTYPERPGARDYVKFLSILDEMNDLELEAGEPLTPTRPVDTET